MKERIIERASKLADLAPRQLEAEQESASLIENELSGVKYNVQHFQVIVPRFEDWSLKVDGEEVECLPSGLKSGEIRSKTLVNSLINGQKSVEKPNISFNPHAEGISVPNFYETPSVAINPRDIQKVVESSRIRGELEVEWTSHRSRNILVGNTETPDRIIMTHYDSLWGGFIDNGFTVSLLVELLQELDLEQNLVVFAGAEEISQESPYHCYGYRRFEDQYHGVIEQTDEILLADSLGRNTQSVIENPEIIEKAIDLNRPGYKKKVKFVASEYSQILDIYHSPKDKRKALNSYEEALNLLKSQLGL